jgi:hypothetical protein
MDELRQVKDDEQGCQDIYRVCAAGEDRWDVYQEPRSRPVASFHDKAAALNYAMCLARGRIAWHLLLRSDEESGVSAGSNEANGPVARH